MHPLFITLLVRRSWILFLSLTVFSCLNPIQEGDSPGQIDSSATTQSSSNLRFNLVGETYSVGLSRNTNSKIWKTVKEVAIPAYHDSKPVTLIEGEAFKSCYNLKKVSLPEGITSIGVGAFFFCESLTDISFPSSLTSIEAFAFLSCYSLTSISLPDKITEIKQNAFTNNWGLTEVRLPDGVTSIGESAFGYCLNLPEIHLPSKVTSIGRSAFSHCKHLEKVVVNSPIPPVLDSYAFYATSPNLRIQVPSEFVETYKSAAMWKDYADKIEAISPEA